MNRLLTYMSIFFAALILMGATITPSHADGAGEIKNRQLVMKALGAHMGAMGNILKGQGGNSGHLTLHASAIANLATLAQDAFPAGSGPEAGKTRALANIWESGSGFQKVLANFKVNADALAKAGQSDDKAAFGKAMGNLGKDSCGTCHKDYRMKEK